MLGHPLTVVVETSLLAPVRPHGIRLVRLEDNGRKSLTSGDMMFKPRGVLENDARQRRLAKDAHPDRQPRTPSTLPFEPDHPRLGNHRRMKERWRVGLESVFDVRDRIRRAGAGRPRR